VTEAEMWEERYLLEAQRYARLLLASTERELDMLRERIAGRAVASTVTATTAVAIVKEVSRCP
jgi:hypothetical protein